MNNEMINWSVKIYQKETISYWLLFLSSLFTEVCLMHINVKKRYTVASRLGNYCCIRTGEVSLKDCLEAFTKEEIMDGDEMPVIITTYSASIFVSQIQGVY